MKSYLIEESTTLATPQSQPIPGREKEMLANSAGGVTFAADSFLRLERFLILGSEGGTYYVGERDLTKENVDNVRASISTDGSRTVNTILGISETGRAPKNDPALYALALAASTADVKTRREALAVLPRVARIGTDLFSFCAYVSAMRGWGPSLRQAVAKWYTSKPEDTLAYQLVKYQQRNGWSHRDVLRLAHVKGLNTPLLRWAIGAGTEARTVVAKKIKREQAYPATEGALPAIIAAFEEAKSADEIGVRRLIADHGLTHEMVPTQHLKSPAVWEVLLAKMPMRAMVRSLGRMGAIGLLAPFSEASKTVVARLGDSDLIRGARIHPLHVLQALLTYKAGHGDKGNLSWTPVSQIVDALDDAFYRAFEYVEPTGKRFFLGIDVSGSMTSGTVAGISNLTPNMGAAAMAMLVARTEPNYFIGGFATSFVDLGVSAREGLDAVMRKCQRSFGGTDCAVAINYALDCQISTDAFVVITDGETWAGDLHASQAIEKYRRRTGIPARLITIQMVPNRTRLTDPKDTGSLDVTGFDASVPQVIREFMV